MALFVLIPILLAHGNESADELVCVGGVMGSQGVWALPPSAQISPTHTAGGASSALGSDPRLGTACTVTTANAAPGTMGAPGPGMTPLPGQPMPVPAAPAP